MPRLRAARSAPSRRPARRAAVAVALAAAIAGAVYSLAPRSAESQRGVTMHSTAAAPAARASLRIGTRDAAGNWQLTLRVRGLPSLPAGGYYAMYLTQEGHIVAGCGTFKVDPGTTVVRFNVPFRLGTRSGWIIRRQGLGTRPGPTLLTT